MKKKTIVTLFFIAYLFEVSEIFSIQLNNNKPFQTLTTKEISHDWRKIHKSIMTTKLYAQATQLDGHSSLSTLEKEYILVENFKSTNIFKKIKSKGNQRLIYSAYLLLKIQLNTQKKFAIIHINNLLNIKYKELGNQAYTQSNINKLKKTVFEEYLLQKLRYSYNKINKNLLAQLTNYYIKPTQANLSKIIKTFTTLTKAIPVQKQSAMNFNHASNLMTLPLLNKIQPIVYMMKKFYYYLGDKNEFPIVIR